MLSTFKTGTETHWVTYDFPRELPIGYTVTPNMQLPTNSPVKNVLRIYDAHKSRSTGDVTYQVRLETVPAT
jgi:hypothetical protein